jgi:proton-dependent oligopeptide transporter, POT family
MAAKQKMSPFPPTFYVANVMEIFERMAWYGFFAVSSLYMTSPIAQGGLGFDSIQRGILQGVIPFLLYLFPVITGAMADRYGYRKTFLVAFAIMTPAYFLLGQLHSFWMFFGAFTLVAVGAATFKPVVVGTVGRLTDDSNRGMGFGIFYTIVNVGGFIGPLVAGYVRAISWDLVFIMSAIWIAINFIPTLFFYKEPPGGSEEKKSIKEVLMGAQEVLGNGRFALIVVPILVLVMISGGGWMSWSITAYGTLIWIIVNLLWNYGVKNASESAPWFGQKAKIGNWPFVFYLLILSGFWASFNQIFITLPEYIRDFVDTGNLVAASGIFGQGFVNFIASVNIEQTATEIQRLASHYPAVVPGSDQAQALFYELVHYKVRVPMDELVAVFNGFAGSVDATTATALANEWADKYRQVNPEYIVNLDALSIVFFQILVSFVIQRWKPFPVLIVGTIVAGTGIALNSIAVTGALTIMAIVIFAFGEMIASPKSQEYVAKIAPKSKTALYMGYYFVSVALGNLFGGILSGWGYQVVAKEWNNPFLMWMIFGGVGFLTAVALLFFNKLVVPHLEAQEQTA